MSEAKISREIRDLLQMVGFAVWSTEQGYRKDPGGTRQTPGIPDLIVLGHGVCLFVEVKSSRGRLRESQKRFRDELWKVALLPDLMDPGTAMLDWQLWRSAQDAWKWCVARGIISEVTT